jgi:hypothetical protein
MKTQELSNIKPHRNIRKKILLAISIVIAVFLVLLLFGAPAFVSSGTGKQLILGIVNKSVPGKTDFSDLSVGWLKGIKVADFSFKDNLGQLSVNVRQIATEPHLGSLLSGNLSFGTTTIDQPSIQINLKQQQKQPANIAVGDKTAVPTKAVNIALTTDIVIKDGNVKITDTAGKTLEVKNINTQASLRPPGGQTSLNLDMLVAQADKPSEVKLSSQITPGKKTGWTLEGTTGEFTVEVNDLDIESLESLFALAGLDITTKGNFSADLKGRVIDGRIETVTGTVNGANLDIAPAQLKGDRIKTSQLTADVKIAGKGQLLNIEKFRLDSDFLNVQAGGTIPAKITSLNELLLSRDCKVDGSIKLDLIQIFSQLTHTLKIKEGIKITTGQLNGDVQAAQGRLTGQVNIKDLAGTLNDKKLALSGPVTAKLDVTADTKTMKLEQIDVTTPFATIKASGDMKNIKYDGQADLAKIQSEIGQFVDFGQYQMAGKFSSNGIVLTEAGKIKSDGSASVANLLFGSKEKGNVSEPKTNVDFSVDFDREKNILNINSIQAVTSFGRIGTNNAIIPINNQSTTHLKADVQVSKLDMSKLLPYAIMFGGLPKEMQLAGIIDANTAISSQGPAYIVKTDSAKIQDLKFAYPDKKPFEQKDTTLKLEAEYIPGKTTIYNAIKKLQLDSPQIKIDWKMTSQIDTNGKTTISGQAQLVYDWTSLSNLVGPYLPAGLTVAGKRQDMLTFSSEYPADKTDMMLTNLNAGGAVGFDKAEYMGLNLGATNVNISVKNGLLEIAPFTTKVNDGQLNFAAQADFKTKPALFKMPFVKSGTRTQSRQVFKDININDKTTHLLLQYLNPIFANAVNVTGIANLSCEKLNIPLDEKAKNSAELTGVVSVTDLRLQTSNLLGQILSILGMGATVITIHPTEFTLKDGFLKYDDMQMDIGENPVNFKGVIGLDKSLDMTVTLPYTTAGATTRTDRQARGSRITLPLTGTLDNPKLDLGKLLETQGIQLLEDALKKGLEIFK